LTANVGLLSYALINAVAAAPKAEMTDIPAGTETQVTGKPVNHRVYAGYLGKRAIVRVFDDGLTAARLVLQLSARYGKHRAKFWHSVDFDKPTERWPVLRDMLQGLEQFMTKGGEITQLPPMAARNIETQHVKTNRHSKSAARRKTMARNRLRRR
jgi:hypothetical protein